MLRVRLEDGGCVGFFARFEGGISRHLKSRHNHNRILAEAGNGLILVRMIRTQM